MQTMATLAGFAACGWELKTWKCKMMEITFFQHTIVEDLPYEHKSFLFIKALSETVFMHELHLK